MTPQRPQLTLSEDQEQALQACLTVCARQDRKPYVLCGPAGTGKTTIMAELAQRLDPRPVGFVAPTGKAAQVLTSRLARAQVWGVASTIHRALYGAQDEVEGEGLIFGLPHAPCPDGAVLIVDEASMVSRKLAWDLQAYMPTASTLLYVGDREQLPPVDGPWGPEFEAPTALLTHIHRQALDSPIIRIATDVRTGGRLPAASEPGYTRSNDAAVQDVVRWMVDRAAKDAVVLCATNKTRSAVNAGVRAGLGLHGPLVAGDRMICLSNHHLLGVMNGEIYDVAKVVRPSSWFPEPLGVVRVESGQAPDHLVMVPHIGGAQKAYFDAAKPYRKKGILHVDYGWCLTVHKSQGSEWDEVAIVLDDALMGWARRDPSTIRRMLYTAVTRARGSLSVFDVRSAA